MFLLNRNVESHFSKLPRANIRRSVFDRSSRHLSSGVVGDLIPFYVDEVLPGDTFDVTTSKVLRFQTLLTPIMDNMYLDTYWFFVPNRLTWSHWEEFCGENKTGPWAQSVVYQIPSIGCPVDSSGNLQHFSSGTLADYFGLPIQSLWKKTDALAPSVLPFRAYSLIVNEFFRDENFANPLLVPLDDASVDGSNDAPYGSNQNLSACSLGGKPYKANRYHDYFSSALPSSQKGEPVQVPVSLTGALSSATAPVYTSGELFYPDEQEYPMISKVLFPIVNDSSIVLPTESQAGSAPLMMRDQASPSHFYGNTYQSLQISGAASANGRDVTSSPVGSSMDDLSINQGIVPLNLRADLEGVSTTISGSAFTINQFRLAYVYQCFLESIARSGSRYGEMLQSIFGVSNPDSRLQHPEYLGGNRIPINVNEITNTAQAEKDFLGDVGAKSATADVNHDFVKSFTEHGLLIGLMVVRYDHSYSQGIERFWTRKQFTDFYNPMFANLGETPIYKAEIYAGGSSYDDKGPMNNKENTFGYQEIWAEYRYKPSRVSGEMRPGVENSLAYWHLGDYYASEPSISESWLFEDKTNVDRCLTVTSDIANQFWFDVYISNRCTRCMPMYSVPGLEPKF